MQWMVPLAGEPRKCDCFERADIIVFLSGHFDDLWMTEPDGVPFGDATVGGWFHRLSIVVFTGQALRHCVARRARDVLIPRNIIGELFVL